MSSQHGASTTESNTDACSAKEQKLDSNDIEEGSDDDGSSDKTLSSLCDDEPAIDALEQWTLSCLLTSCFAVFIQVCTHVVQYNIGIRHGHHKIPTTNELLWLTAGWQLTLLRLVLAGWAIMLTIGFLTCWIMRKQRPSKRLWWAIVGGSCIGTTATTQLISCIASILVTARLARYEDLCGT